MEKSGFFNAMKVGDTWDRVYKAKNFAEYFASFVGNGVFPNPSTNLQVISNNNMNVIIKPGKAWINGFIYMNTSDFILPVEVADGSLSRIDRIIVRYDIVERDIRVGIRKGTFASNPTAPGLQRDTDAYELGLADIYINAGAISIVQSDITDLRLNKDLCGIVHGTVDQIDTTTLFNQYLDWYKRATKQAETNIENIQSMFMKEFEAWFSNLKSVLDGNTAGNLFNLINDVPKIFEGKEEPQGIRTGDFWLKEV